MSVLNYILNQILHPYKVNKYYIRGEYYSTQPDKANKINTTNVDNIIKTQPYKVNNYCIYEDIIKKTAN